MADGREYISRPHPNGSINISEEVIAILASTAALEADGVVDVAVPAGREIAEFLGKKSATRGVKIHAEGDEVVITINVLCRLGCAIGDVAADIQKRVVIAVESVTGLKVAAVNVQVCGLKLDR